MYGDTTQRFIEFLIDRGPQTAEQLKDQPFWGGVRSRVGILVKQGQIEKVRVPNPLSSPRRYSRAVCVAFKAMPGATGRPIRERKDGKIRRERRAEERAEKRVAKAIEFLEQRGYVVTAPNV